MSPVLVIPFFALFGAFLTDARGDVRKSRRDLMFFQSGEREARRTRTSTREVEVDARAYAALRKAAQIRAMSSGAVTDARKLLSSLEGDGTLGEVLAARKILSSVLERDALVGELEASIRQQAMALPGSTGR